MKGIMAAHNIYEETSITADTDSTVFAIPDNADRYSIQVVWANMVGAGDGTIDLEFSLLKDSNFEPYSGTSAITTTATGDQPYDIIAYRGKFMKLVYTKNSNTSIDLKILSNLDLAQVQ